MEAGAIRSSGTIRSWVIGILLTWVAVFAASFIVPMFIAPTGELYMRGLNRLSYWFWLQVAAFVLAVAVWALAQSRRRDISRRLMWLSRVPVLVAAVEVLAVAWIIQGTFFRP
jgi:hypothetical protein